MHKIPILLLLSAILLQASLKNRMTLPYLQRFKDDINQKEIRYPDTIISEGKSEHSDIYLTFDDGPDATNTPKILEILKNEGIKATFFFLGDNIIRHKNVVKKTFEEGHAVASHGYAHVDFRKESPEKVYEEHILKTNLLIKEITGKSHSFFRPPYGAVTDEQIVFLKKRGLKIIEWSIDSFDWQKGADEKIIVDEIMENIHIGAIILLHSSGANKKTPGVLRRVIKEIKKAGYGFGTVDQIVKRGF